jgi:DNA mismatch repair ATPase MutS
LKKDKIIKFEYKEIEYDVKLEELEFRHLPKGNSSKIFIKEMAKNSTKMLEYQDELKILQKNYYINFLELLTERYSKMIYLTYKYISLIDFLKSGAKISIKYHYTLPKIETDINEKEKEKQTKSWFKAQQLRHPIIELLSDKEFIPTDIELGTENQDGILLFGLNSAGKIVCRHILG